MQVVLPQVGLPSVESSSWVRESVRGLARALKVVAPPQAVPDADADASAVASRALRALDAELPRGRTALIGSTLTAELADRAGLPLVEARAVAAWTAGALAVEGTTAVDIRAVTRDDEERARVRLTLHTVTGHLPPAAPVVSREVEVALVRPRGHRRWKVQGRRCLMVL